jgi:hypothetical protein
MIVKLSHKVAVSLMRWLFREATTYFSLLALSPLHHQESVRLTGRWWLMLIYSERKILLTGC